MKKRQHTYLIFFLLITTLLCTQPGGGTSITAEEEVLKAAFVFRFAQFTTWPEPLDGEFRLCLYGGGRVTDMIEAYSGRALHGSTFTTIRPDNTTLSGSQCNAAFISNQDRTAFRDLINSRGDHPILLISDIPGALEENTDIALNTEPNRVTFSINLTQAKTRMFTFSGQMLKLAQKVR